MLFNTLQYLIFLPIVVLIYYFLPKKVRYIWLLIVSYYFYMQWNPLYIILLFSCTLLTYLCGRIIGKLKNLETDYTSGSSLEVIKGYQKKQKICLTACILLNLCILGYFKYFIFGISLVNRLLRLIHWNEVSWDHDILLPVGISFYTLQAFGYLIYLYCGDVRVERKYLKYALYVAFYPQLVEGTIER